MADSTLTGLSAASALSDADLLYVVQSATSLKATGTQLKTYTSASPTLVTPVLGVATGTSIALGGATLGAHALAVTGSVQISGAVLPSANDGSALGSTTLSWSDLFLAEGGVINWDNSDATITQVGNDITFNGVSSLTTTATFLCGAITDTGVILVRSGTTIPAGGATTSRIGVSSTNTFGIYWGSGAPTLSAAQGSVYLRSDGSGVADRFYVNTTGSTTWTNVVTAA